MSDSIELLDVVALTVDLAQHHLSQGQLGTVVELLGSEAYEVEFSDDKGQTYACVPLRREQLMVLHYEPVATV